MSPDLFRANLSQKNQILNITTMFCETLISLTSLSKLSRLLKFFDKSVRLQQMANFSAELIKLKTQ